MGTVGRRRYTTESGSVYTIDFNKKTWARTMGKDASFIRSDSGTFKTFDITNGFITMICPPFHPTASQHITREITSMLITKVEDLDDVELPIEGPDSNEPD